MSMQVPTRRTGAPFASRSVTRPRSKIQRHSPPRVRMRYSAS
jgi:hypothetical protein